MNRTIRILGLTACAGAVALLTLALLTAGAQAGSDARASGVWLKLPVIAGRPAALYGSLSSDSGDRLLAVEVTGAARAELHRSREEKGIMRMEPVDSLPLAAGRPLHLRQGGEHVMVFGLSGARPGDEIPVTFILERAGRIKATAKARSATDAQGHEHHH